MKEKSNAEFILHNKAIIIHAYYQFYAYIIPIRKKLCRLYRSMYKFATCECYTKDLKTEILNKSFKQNKNFLKFFIII